MISKQSIDPPAADPPAVGAIVETSLYVDDLDRAQAFYRRIFGFATMMQDARMCAMAVAAGQVLLLFRRGGSVTPRPAPGGSIPPHDGAGHLHLCFAIATDELAAWEQHLSTQDITIESRVTWPRGGVSLYFRDPDNNSLECATPGLWPNY